MNSQSTNQPSHNTTTSESMTSAQRRKLDKRKEKLYRYKVTYDLTQELADAIYSIALELKCSISDVAMALLCDGLEHYYSGELDLEHRLTPHSFSLRFAFKLTPPQLPRPIARAEEVITANE